MSTTRTYKIEITETKEIATSADFLEAIQSLEKVLEEKLRALSSALRGMKICVKEGTIFITDTYGTYNNLEQELSAFGFTVEKVAGNMYKASDKATALLDLLKKDRLSFVSGGTFFMLEMDEKLAEKVKLLSGIKLPEIERLKQNTTLTKILDSLREGESYTVSDKIVRQGQEYAHDYKNFVKKQGTEAVVSRENNIQESRQAFAEINQVIGAINNSHTRDMVNGNETLIKNRAKAMGFTVKTITVDGKTTLTLERSV